MPMKIQKKLILEDCIEGMKKLPDQSIDIVLADPPYNIGKDFGNDSDKKSLDEYKAWSKEWTTQAKRILKPDGTLYIYGVPEILAHVAVDLNMNQKWLQWHYTNKNVPSLKFWQRSHESIIMAWSGDKPHFNLDAVREPYSDTFLKNAAGKTRKATKGRFSKGDKETVYTAHENGALPRDVLKYPALAGGAGASERWFYCPICKEAFPNNQKAVHEKHADSIVQHPTQKPYKLTENLLKAVKPSEGGIVVVPFAGSGAELKVIQDLGMEFIGFEINPDYYHLALSYLEKTSVSKNTKTSKDK